MTTKRVSKNTRYPINQSPLYRLSTRTKLVALVGEIPDEIWSAASYRVFRTTDGRVIQAPTGALLQIHGRLARLLARIAIPDYLYATKGRSYKDNAAQHANGAPAIKVDIAKFFPSVSFSSLYRVFVEDFQCPADVAWRLAKVCCFRGTHLPTGSEISSYLAFRALKPALDEIDQLAQQHGCRMTCHGDDIVVSGSHATKALQYRIVGIIRRLGFAENVKKLKSYPGELPRVLTGVAVDREKLKLPLVRHHLIAEARREVSKAVDQTKRAKLVESLRGRLEEGHAIDPTVPTLARRSKRRPPAAERKPP